MKNPPPTPPADGAFGARQDASCEPWLAHLAAPCPEPRETSAADFVARVMRAPATEAREPWLEWLGTGRDRTDTQSPEASVFESAVFARRVAHAFAVAQPHPRQRIHQRIKEWGWRLAGGLAACLALVVAFWPAAKPAAPHAPAPAAMAHAAPASIANTLTVALQQRAEGWLTQQAQRVSATLASTQRQATSVLSEYATPIKVSCYFLGLKLPVPPPAQD